MRFTVGFSAKAPVTVSNSKRIAAALSAIVLLGGLSACAAGKPEVVPSDATATPVVTIHAVDNSFEPSEVEIEAGQAVRWVFAGTNQHDVVADDGGFVSELMYSGEYVHTFDEAGEFGYDCSIHPEMRGTVVVR